MGGRKKADCEAAAEAALLVRRPCPIGLGGLSLSKPPPRHRRPRKERIWKFLKGKNIDEFYCTQYLLTLGCGFPVSFELPPAAWQAFLCLPRHRI